MQNKKKNRRRRFYRYKDIVSSYEIKIRVFDVIDRAKEVSENSNKSKKAERKKNELIFLRCRRSGKAPQTVLELLQNR